MKHTDTPWIIKECEDKALFIVHNSSTICALRDKVNAEFIVKCCNSHDKLVEALKDLLDDHTELVIKTRAILKEVE